ncbi:MAG TPA: SpvB/TcaC N-terminal domain-containing protein, partial [Candidatus Saccharimonadales bacterium]|nr:SpvB/TcaC N-terminal domain-containing protein [Candidatus Saccharimonadales bacterium]
MFNTQSGKTEPRAIEKPSISLPKGGGAIKGIDEKFSVNAANGTASFSLPLPVAPARGVAPEMSLTYNSGNGNGVFGLGWNVDIGSIKRKTNQELPQYLDSADSDTYLFAGAEDLVPEFQKEPDGTFSKDPKGNYVILERNSSDGGFTIRCYRPRIEGLFTRIERWMHKTTGVIKWRVITKENTTTLLGWTAAARIADPADPRRVYEWLPEFVFDDSGNCCHYIYKAEDDAGFDPTLPHNANRRQNGQLTYANQYLSSIRYGNKTPYQTFDAPFPAEQDYMFQTVFDYGEYDSNSPYQKINDWLYRPDAFSDYKAGFEIRTTRLCQRVLLFHYFDELPSGNALVKSLNFTYDTSREQGFTFLTSVAIYGYVKKPDNTYTHKQMPPIEFAYQEHAWSKTVRTVNTEALVHAPAGLHESTYQFTDLYGEGLSGILTEQDGAWYYKRNLGGGKFARAAKVSPKPTFKGLGDKVYLADLDGDGSKQLVSTAQPPQGFFELDNNQGGPTFRTFKHQPNVNFKDQNTRMIDITGDGKPDLLITEDQVFTWYESEGREGYKSARRTPKPFDEEKGPAVIFADSKQTIFLADMDGDGLTDIVRIRANETCYWPNLGYGRFGSKVAMDNPPNLDAPDSFNPSYVRLGDIDGSGTTDIIYLGRQKFSCWLNLNGNAFTSTPFEITAFPEIHNSATVTLADLLGTGTLCIVWSSPLAKDAQSPLRYIDLMDSKKPHVMTGYQNNFGKEVRLHYKPSTAFYLEAEKAGRPWVTKLHFPLQCLAKSEIIDHVTGQEFASTYAYHHGYYDHAEREFRGFGLVEQTDTEEFDHWTRSGNSAVEQDLQQEPVVKKSWFHTGAFLKNQTILHQFAGEYWYTEMARHGFSVTHNEHDLPDARLHAAANIDPILLDHLTGQERQQAVRACKGTVLRTEIFAHDAPAMDATPDELQRQLTPYTVETKNCNIELLQPKGQNKYAVFITKESETLTYAYERDTTDPRITHNLNLVFDEYGNVLESAQVVYAREIAEGGLPAAVQQAQTRTYITYKSIKLTNDVLGDDVYRLRVPSEDRTYELRGVAKSGNYYLPANFDNIFAVATEIPYHQKDNNPPSGSPQKRLVEHFRSTYRKNDLTGPLPLHQLESRALPFESYQLAYTPELLTNIFGVHATDALMLEGKFTHSEGDANWWVRSGTTQYLEPGETISDAANRFFVPLSYTDPFGAVTKVTYLGDFTFVASTEDALGNKTSIDVFSYRTLSPLRVRDMNDNLSEVIYDELGRVKASAQLGKGAEADDLAGLQEITTPLEETEVAAFFNAVNPSELTARGKALLGHASVRMVYNLTAFQTSGKPVASASITREQHFKDNAGSPVQLSFEYTGGLAQVVMKKNQAEPGPAKKLDLAPDNTYVLTTVDTSPELRWVGTGRTVLNNKGNPVKQYEPYFSVTHQYEDNKELVESGVTPLFYYDALGREVKVDLPDGTFSKVAFTSWQQTLYDPGDTVKDSAWYNNRVNSIINAELLAEGKDPLKEKLAAIASEQYYDTPTVQYFDTLGRGIMQVQHNRVNGTDELYQSQVVLDIEGNLRQVIDARGNAVMNYAHDMLGRGVYQNSPDSGKRWQLANVMGESLRAWDERNHEFQYVYDLLGRALQTRVVGGDGDTPLNNIYERIVYGESLPNPKAKNLRGEVMRFYDTGGLVETREYDFKGQPLSNNRRLFA